MKSLEDQAKHLFFVNQPIIADLHFRALKMGKVQPVTFVLDLRDEQARLLYDCTTRKMGNALHLEESLSVGNTIPTAFVTLSMKTAQNLLSRWAPGELDAHLAKFPDAATRLVAVIRLREYMAVASGIPKVIPL